MEITRTSGISNVTRTREIPVTPEQYRSWQEGMLIQKAMPNLSADDREFIMTGITPEEWEDVFGKED